MPCVIPILPYHSPGGSGQTLPLPESPFVKRACIDLFLILLPVLLGSDLRNYCCLPTTVSSKSFIVLGLDPFELIFKDILY